ncbi:hypothetical protein A6I87_00305 [Prescottella equi]|uniref:hypothetical protein n=1 Tax=Rhodococcus hoagii TaxID=43767 RepID=UPI000A0F4AA9|nr:hypothetical protein [Prescottella equi]ORL37890.1 hypothetical protein A6I87_00305 [Prescottella equi]
MTYTLEQACRDLPALGAKVRGDWNALLAANPLVDQIRAARDPRERVIGRDGRLTDRLARPFSPAARSQPKISAGLDRAQQIPPRFDFVGLRGVDRVYGNNGRRVLPLRLIDETDPAGPCRQYTAEELKAEERKRLGITEQQQRELDAEYEQMLDLAEYGGQPVGAVVFHCEEWSETDGALACPVVPGLPAVRLARLVSLASCVCYWCGCREAAPLDDHLLVSAGGFLRVFPTCSQCRDGFDRDTGYTSLDWLVLSDDWDRSVGYPSDEWR